MYRPRGCLTAAAPRRIGMRHRALHCQRRQVNLQCHGEYSGVARHGEAFGQQVIENPRPLVLHLLAYLLVVSAAALDIFLLLLDRLFDCGQASDLVE